MSPQSIKTLPARGAPGALAWAIAPFLAACVSGRTQAGVDRPQTARENNAGHAQSQYPTCRGKSWGDVWAADPGVCVTWFASELIHPRHLVFGPDGQLIVSTRQGLMALRDTNGDGSIDDHEKALFGAPDLSNQGLAISPDGRFVYYAGDRYVRRVPYRSPFVASTDRGETVISDLPATISHPYKTLTFDPQGRLYVMVGARDNLTPGEGAVIMRYTVPDALPANGLAYASGEAFARGLRNAEALAWDHEGKLWAFVNGRDYLHPQGAPDTFYFDHPGDWVYRLSDRAGAFYGFPYCWVLGAIPWGAHTDPASQWADPEISDGHDDAWCQNPANVEPAAGALPAHTAPLAAVEYTGNLFPSQYRGNIFVASHGSWDRPTAQIGRTILRVSVQDGRVSSIQPFIGERVGGGNLREGHWNERPVGITQGPDGALYFTSDDGGNVFRVGYAHE